MPTASRLPTAPAPTVFAALTAAVIAAAIAPTAASAAPTVSRLTPPSEWFTNHRAAPIVARFLPGQRFDLQATLRPDSPTATITQARFAIDDKPLATTVALRDCAAGCAKNVPTNAAIATLRAASVDKPGIHRFSVTATQSDGQTVSAEGNFEVVALTGTGLAGPKVKNIVILLGDGMGAAQRTAARIVRGGYAQGKVIEPLAMDGFPVTGMVKTASLNSVVTDSSPGMTGYVSGNKNNNNEEGVFPDDTVDPFDNPRIEYLSEYLHRTMGKSLGLVTTADVFDATPAGNAVHTSNRGAGTGIVDQYLDDRGLTGLDVLMGGGRKWFLPASVPGSARGDRTDYAFSATDAHTAEIVKRWGAAPGALDKDRDLIADFAKAGFAYAPDKAALEKLDGKTTERLLGLFSLSNMNVALDKIDGRRGTRRSGVNGAVVDDYGFPDQPMLDEMTDKALAVLSRKPKGFVLMVEGASIDKQAHAMDTERWMLDTIEFDRAIARVRAFAEARGDTLVIVTADHECSGAALIGGSRVSDAKLVELARANAVPRANPGVASDASGAASAPPAKPADPKASLRDQVVGVYEQAGFPAYRIAADGYPETTDIDFRLLVGYGANADRYEDWHTNARPLQDGQQPFVKREPLSTYPATPLDRDRDGNFLVTGQVPGESAVHTATDVPLSAFGPGAWTFTGVQDNTDVFFKLAQAAVKGVIWPAGLKPVAAGGKR